MNSKLRFNRSLASRFSSLALCLLLSSGVGRAQETDWAREIYSLLESVTLGSYQYIVTYPTYENGGGTWEQLLGPALFENGDSAGDAYLHEILDLLQQGNLSLAFEKLSDILDFLSQSTDSEYSSWRSWRADWDEIYGSALRNLNQNIDFVTFDSWSQVGSGSPVVSVFDEPGNAKLLTFLRLLQDDVIPALQSMDGASSSQVSGLEEVKTAIDDLVLTIQGISEDWLTLEQLENRDRERDEDLRQDGESSAREAQDSLASNEREYQTDAQGEVRNYQEASEELVETQDFDFDMETENPYDEFDTLSKDATDKFKEIVGKSEDYTYSGPDDLVLLDTPALDWELFPGLGIVKYNYTLHHGLRNWSQQSRRITSWAWRLMGFVMQLSLIVRFIMGAMSGFSYTERKTSDF